MSLDTVYCSVVIPAYNAEQHFKQCLESLFSSDLPPDECIVVDDGSSDRTVEVAASFGAVVLSTGGRCGPAVARNLGCERAQGEIVLFIDADVCVHSDTLSRVVASFKDDPSQTAIMGSYDGTPLAPGVVSQYRNLLHHYTHQTSRREATTFWSGCGAVRRKAFLEAGGFDAAYCRPAIEDIELGYRLHAAGHKLVLDPDILVKHLKRWRVRTMLRADIFDRGIPWTLLVLRAGRMPNDLNVKMRQRLSVAAIGVVIFLACWAAVAYGGSFLAPVAGAFMLGLGSFWVTEAFQPKTLLIRCSMVVALVALTILAVVLHLYFMAGLVLFGYAFLFLRELLSRVSIRLKRPLGLAYGVYLAVAVSLTLSVAPKSYVVLGFVLTTALLVLLNYRFYLFLLSRLGGLCGIAAIPFHLLYYAYGGLSFAAGVYLSVKDRRAGRQHTIYKMRKLRND